MLKKIILIIILLFIYFIIINYKLKSTYVFKVDLNLDEDEIGLIVDSRYLLINKTNENILILLDKIDEKAIDNELKTFGINRVNNLLSNEYTNIKYDYKYNITDNNNFGSVKSSFNNNFNLNIYDYNFCIYKQEGNMDNCTFIYFKNINDDVNINEKNKAIFYNEDASEKFKEKLYTKWIDTYELNSTSYIVIKIKKDNYNIINISK